MNALERTFINKNIRFTVSTLENENFGFKRISYSRHEAGCTVQLAKYSKEFDKMQNITVYGNNNGTVERIEYMSREV